MNQDELKAIKARAEAATPGGWQWVCDDPSFLTLGKEGAEQEFHVLSAWRCDACIKNGLSCAWPKKEDAALIAHSREDIPALLAYIEELREKANVSEKYATAARVIHLYLAEFCNEKLAYDEMIADAARKASKRIEELQADNAQMLEDISTIKSCVTCVNQPKGKCPHDAPDTSIAYKTWWTCRGSAKLNWQYRGRKEK